MPLTLLLGRPSGGGGGGATGYSGSVLADGPQGYWRLGESVGLVAVDSSPSGRNGSYQPTGVTYGQAGGVVGDPNTAVLLDGAAGYVSVPDNAAWDLAGDATLEMWVRFAVTTGGQTFISHDDGAGGANKWVWWLNAGIVQLHYNTVAGPGSNVYSVAWVPVANTYYHLAMVKSGTNYTFYVNGVGQGVQSSATPTPPASAALVLGWSESTLYLNGRIDEVAVYATALSAGRILAHYQAGP